MDSQGFNKDIDVLRKVLLIEEVSLLGKNTQIRGQKQKFVKLSQCVGGATFGPLAAVVSRLCM